MPNTATGLDTVVRQQEIDRDDRDLLKYVVSWLPYGTVPEGEILIRFGLTGRRFPSRLREAIDRQRRHIHPHTAERLISLCDRIEAGTPGQASQAVPHSLH